MNDFLCSLDGRWAVGSYCVEPGVVILGGAVLAILGLLVILSLIAGPRRRLRERSCPVCGLTFATRHQMIAHRSKDHAP